MTGFRELIAGFRLFKATLYEEQRDLIKHLVRQDSKPKIMVIACSDMRIAPGKIFNSNPGDLYVLRNIAALVPTYNKSGANGIMAAIEYGVNELEVETVIVLGHSKCDGINYHMDDTKKGKCSTIDNWLEIINPAKQEIKKQLHNKNHKIQVSSCEFESILVSMKNLLAYPSVKKRVESDKLKLYGWHFDIEKGVLKGFDPETQFFEPIG